MKIKHLLLPLLLFVGISSYSQNCNCLLPIDSTFQVVQFTNGTAPDYRNDDGSSAEMTLPFTFSFYNNQFNSVFINNNGNISFATSYVTFSSSSFPSNQYLMVAPFWADVDTRDALSGLVYYKLTPTSLIVRWDSVGYFSSNADKLNTFQLIITDGSNADLPNNYNVQFCYGDMQWTTGTASGSNTGFGGTPATVGVNLGNGIDYWQVGRFDHEDTDHDGPFGANDGVSWLDNKVFYANTSSSPDTTDPLVINTNLCDTVFAPLYDPQDFEFLSIMQLPGYSLSVSVDTSNISSFTYQNYVDPGNRFAKVNGTFFPTNDITGTQELVVNVRYTHLLYDSINVNKKYSYYYNVAGCETPGTVEITSTQPDMCQGQTVSLHATPGYVSYTWLSDNSTNDTLLITAAGEYTVAVTDSNGCGGTASILIAETEMPDFEFLGGDTQQDYVFVCSNFGVFFGINSVNPVYNYTWSYDGTEGNDLYIGNLPNDTTFVLTVTATDTLTGCTLNKSINILAEICGGLNEGDLANIVLYPNPAANILTWKYNNYVAGDDGKLEIFSSTGQLVYTANITGNIEVINLNGIPQGMYYFKTILNKGISVKPFVKIN
jgi:Secretion system C-terminal sorting domain